jgi:Zn-dependent peptidase ImmA (M78 family)
MKARDILRDAGITIPPVDVKSIAESFFLQVVQSDTRRYGGRALLEHGQIHVNASESPAGQRFSIGHEIGHYVLHPDGFVFSAHEDPQSELYAEDPDNELEREADYFSSVLLVPPSTTVAEMW